MVVVGVVDVVGVVGVIVAQSSHGDSLSSTISDSLLYIVTMGCRQVTPVFLRQTSAVERGTQQQ